MMKALLLSFLLVGLVLPIDGGSPPSHPINLYAFESEQGVLLSWNNSNLGGAPLGYMVSRSNASIEGGGFGPGTIVYERYYLDEVAIPGERYFYAVKAFNEHGESADSIVATNTVYPHCVWFAYSIDPVKVRTNPGCLFPPPEPLPQEDPGMPPGYPYVLP